ncbi:MAG TPA: metallophosphoesterase [Solirubrobacteraceae bacterium]|nr:metallophosphoesterase [Solirubrobacteraceae bacterium]
MARGEHSMFTPGWCAPAKLVGLVEIVIGDVHARSEALRMLLGAVGAVDARGRRRGGCWVVQLGDLLDRRATAAANLAAARLAASAVDVVLAGNHEVRILGEPGCVHGAALATLAVRGWPHAAACCGEWLVTHAGVHPELARGLSPQAAECAEEINDRWHRRGPAERGDPLFDWVGPARGGDAPHGGIFWTHPVEWGAGLKSPWGQIVGHVPQPKPRLLPGRRWAIDLGARDGRVAALVRASGRQRWRPVVVRAGV